MDRGHGFTLVELLATLAIVAILVAMGVPAFAGFMRQLELAAATNDLFAAIHLARAEAIRLDERVDMVPAGADGDWSSGWVVFVDRNDNQRADNGERILFRHGPAPKGLQIKAVLTDSTVQYLAYTGAGRTRTNASAYRTQFGTFTLQSGDRVRKIKLNFLGRPRICNPEQEKTSC